MIWRRLAHDFWCVILLDADLELTALASCNDQRRRVLQVLQVLNDQLLTAILALNHFHIVPLFLLLHNAVHPAFDGFIFACRIIYFFQSIISKDKHLVLIVLTVVMLVPNAQILVVLRDILGILKFLLVFNFNINGVFERFLAWAHGTACLIFLISLKVVSLRVPMREAFLRTVVVDPWWSFAVETVVLAHHFHHLRVNLDLISFSFIVVLRMSNCGSHGRISFGEMCTGNDLFWAILVYIDVDRLGIRNLSWRELTQRLIKI